MDVFLVDERERAAGPTTHALVIGVGLYPHLPGGGKRTTAFHDGMQQLTSPTTSARRFAEWLIEWLEPPGKPLATVGLLLSERPELPFTNPNTGVDHPVALATSDNITTAIKDWKTRGDSHPDNLLLFYFCGHGIAEGTDMALLLRDYSEDDDNSLKGALDFMKLHVAMDRCHARKQIFFVDACRATSDNLRGAMGYAGQVPIQPGAREPGLTEGRRAPVYFSTLAGKEAYGRPNGLSAFTNALLAGLNGAASASAPDGTWLVDTMLLQRAMNKFMKLEKDAGVAEAQVPEAGNGSDFALHRLSREPEVPVFVSCLPEEALTRAVLRCIRAGKPPLERQPVWNIVLTAGDYQFCAEFTDSSYRGSTVERLVHPTTFTVDVSLQVTR